MARQVVSRNKRLIPNSYLCVTFEFNNQSAIIAYTKNDSERRKQSEHLKEKF